MAADRLSLVFGALADPTRRAILGRLAEGEATVAELAAPFAVSQHCKAHMRVRSCHSRIGQRPITPSRWARSDRNYH